MGSGCGSVGRAVASNYRGPWFEFSHQQNLHWMFTNNCIERRKERKEAGNGPNKIQGFEHETVPTVVYLSCVPINFLPLGDACTVDNEYEHATIYDTEFGCWVNVRDKGEKVKVSATETGIPIVERFVCGPNCKETCNSKWERMIFTFFMVVSAPPFRQKGSTLVCSLFINLAILRTKLLKVISRKLETETCFSVQKLTPRKDIWRETGMKQIELFQN